MSADLPYSFDQTDIVNNGDDKVIMKVRGRLVDMLVSLGPVLYKPFVVFENNITVLYVQLHMALYGTLQAALPFYKKLKKDLECIGFKIIPYDPCAANCIVNIKQQTVAWHVDDLKSSHEDSTVNDDFLK
jgi:hypothetical protein